MFSSTCLAYTQSEIAWGLLCLAARFTGSTQLLFVDDETPLWAQQGVVNFERLQGALPKLYGCLQRAHHNVPCCVRALRTGPVIARVRAGRCCRRVAQVMQGLHGDFGVPLQLRLVSSKHQHACTEQQQQQWMQRSNPILIAEDLLVFRRACAQQALPV